MLSVFDMFSVGIGPSSSHTVGPMRAARAFTERLADSGRLERVTRVRVELFGSLGLTGRGHGSDKAVLLGLEGARPEDVDVDAIPARLEAVRAEGRIALLGRHPIAFDAGKDLVFHKRQKLPGHPNGMRFTALGDDAVLAEGLYYSVGGGFVVDAEGEALVREAPAEAVPYPFASGAELLAHCEHTGLPISALMLANEQVRPSEASVRARLLEIWAVMQACVAAGCRGDGKMPGLGVERRAGRLARQLEARAADAARDPLTAMDWVNVYALAVNEENACGGRVVTAPTNGAAGVIPAVLHYYVRFCGGDDDAVVRFLLTAAAIGILIKRNASISGAEVGCQGEIGSACAMAAGALAEVLGGSAAMVENAAEIGMEHNLGLTCDPVGGLVQVPCIERNAMASVKAINAARLALQGDGKHFISLDRVIRTMRDTGRDMKDKYKETARGGLAVNVAEISVNLPEC